MLTCGPCTTEYVEMECLGLYTPAMLPDSESLRLHLDCQHLLYSVELGEMNKAEECKWYEIRERVGSLHLSKNLGEWQKQSNAKVERVD